MTEYDFEKYWQEKFAACIEAHTKPGTMELIMAAEGAGIPWTIAAIERLTENVDEETAQKILAGCACEYPKQQLREIKLAYAEHGLEAAHKMLQEQFLAALPRTPTSRKFRALFETLVALAI